MFPRRSAECNGQVQIPTQIVPLTSVFLTAGPSPTMPSHSYELEKLSNKGILEGYLCAFVIIFTKEASGYLVLCVGLTFEEHLKS